MESTIIKYILNIQRVRLNSEYNIEKDHAYKEFITDDVVKIELSIDEYDKIKKSIGQIIS